MSAPTSTRPAGLSRLLATLALVIGLWGALTVFSTLRLVLFLAFLSVLGATVVSYPIRWLSRRMRRSVAVAITFVSLVGAGAALVVVIVPVVVRQAGDILQQVPPALEKVEQWWRSHIGAGAGGPSLRRNLPAQNLTELLGKVAGVAFGTLSAVSAALLVVVLSFFLAYDPETYRRGAISLVPVRYRNLAAEYLRRMGETLRGWLLGTLVSMTIIGVLCSVGLLLLGIDAWIALGVLAFFGEFVPFLGPVLSAVPAVAVGLARSPLTALYIATLYFLVQELEGNIVQPLVMRRAVHLQPALLLVWQILLASAFGLLGLIIATPLLACVKVTVDLFYVERAQAKP